MSESRLVHAWEWTQARLAHGGWPARLARRVGWQRGVRLRRERVALPGRDAARPPLRIAFASDFHAGPLTHPEHLKAACAALAAARPDVVLYGGDFVNFEAAYAPALAALLGAVPAPLGRYAVLGNHDYWAEPAVSRALWDAGIVLLTNTSVRLAEPHDDVWVCGLDDHLLGAPDAARALSEANGVRVVLMHAPSSLLDLAGARFDLALCGHTHGGQITLPSGWAPMLPAGRLSRLYPHGRFDVGEGRTLVVSRGVGYTLLPLRLFAWPEVHLVTLGGPA
jgi:uncharacterized protein